MWRLSSCCALMVATFFLVMPWSGAEAQRRSYYGGRLNTQRLVRRIEELERRVTALERLRGVPVAKAVNLSASPVSVEEAEQLVATTADRHAFSERMYKKGYISEAEMEADKYEATRAELLLQLAKATRDQQPTEQLTQRFEILEAEFNLNVATRQLQLAESLTAKGLLGTDLPAYRQAVEEAKQELEAMQERIR